MNQNNLKNEFTFRKLKNKELSDFIDYAFESTRKKAENERGISFKLIKMICHLNRFLLGFPMKILARNSDNMVLVKKDTIYAGFSAIYDKKKNEFMIGNIFTRRKYQGQGLGNLLIEYIVEKYGKSKLVLGVDITNEAALHLYKKYGFSEKSSIQEFLFPTPLKTRSFPKGFYARKAKKEDLTNISRLTNEIPDMDDLSKQYKKSFKKAKRKRMRLQYQLPAVLLNDKDEIVGIGRARWSKITPNLAQIIATAILPESKEAYPSFISFLTENIVEYDISKVSWEKTENTEKFFEEIAPFLGKPYRIGWTMEREPIVTN